MTDTPPDGTERPPEDSTDPEQIGSDLLRRLDMLDDRLQRSQEQMLSLLDQKLHGLQGTSPAAPPNPAAPQDPAASQDPAAPQDPAASKDAGDGPAPERTAPASPPALWAPPPPAPSPAPAPSQTPSQAGPAINGVASGSPVPRPEGQGVAEQESLDAWFGRAAATSPAPVTRSTSERPSASGEHAAGEPAASQAGGAGAPAEMAAVDIVPAHRPAWQSNALAVAITALVVVVGLFLVGLF